MKIQVSMTVLIVLIVLLVIGGISLYFFLTKTSNKHKEEITLLQNSNNELDKIISDLQGKVSESHKVVDSLKEKISKAEQKADLYTRLANEKIKELATIKNKYSELETDSLRKLAIERAGEQISLDSEDEDILIPRKAVEYYVEKEEEVGILLSIVTMKDSILSSKNRALTDSRRVIERLESDIETLYQISETKDTIIANKDKELDIRKKEGRKLKGIIGVETLAIIGVVLLLL